MVSKIRELLLKDLISKYNLSMEGNMILCSKCIGGKMFFEEMPLGDQVLQGEKYLVCINCGYRIPLDGYVDYKEN